MASSGPSSDRPTTPSGSSDRHPLSHTGSGTSLVQIGHYVLGETLGIGTFGKVKGIVKINIVHIHFIPCLGYNGCS